MKKLTISLLLLAFVTAGFSQVNNNFESGNRAIDKNNCWQFNSTNVNASGAIEGKYSCQTGSLSGGFHSLVSPWVEFTGSGSLTFSHNMSSGNGPSRTLTVYLVDRNDAVKQTLYVSKYPGDKTTVIKAEVSMSSITGLYRIKWEFTGEGGSSKGTLDLISIPGTYSADPTANDGSGNCGALVKVADIDKDGIADKDDAYPNDPLRAFNNLYPVLEWGSLGFEDLWPSKGDYDFNDLVVDYKCNVVTDAKNEIVEMKASFLTRAIGASFHSAFGVNLINVPSASVISVTNSLENPNGYGYFKIAGTGIETGQTWATIIVFDDAFRVLPAPGQGSGVNTTPGAPYVVPKQVDVVVTLKSNGNAVGKAINIIDWPQSNINFFIVVKSNQGRGIEVHLPDYHPTDLADPNLFGTMDDGSNLDQSYTYRSRNNLPWVINVLSSFSYPVEKADIVKTHLKFGPWAETSGLTYPDWYLEKSEFRNLDLIYKH